MVTRSPSRLLRPLTIRRSSPAGQPPAAQPAVPRRSGITIWGPPTTGKTTFLAALAHALADQPSFGWRVRGMDQISTDELTTLTSLLVAHGHFPQASLDLQVYQWALVKSERMPWYRCWFGLRGRLKARVVPLRVADGPGGWADHDHWKDRPDARQLIKEITSSAGIIFIFDPTREFEQGDAYRHTQPILTQVDAASDLLDGTLPHYMAVCVAKFDDPRVYGSAAMLGLATYDSEHGDIPYVHADFAEEFFNRMCQVPTHPAAHGLLKVLKQPFRESRLKFFVTSAIGFHIGGSGRFDPGDFENIVPGDPPMVRGEIHPINIAESVVWLADRLVKEAKE